MPTAAIEPTTVAPKAGAAKVAAPGMTTSKMAAIAKVAASAVTTSAVAAAVATAVLCQGETGRDKESRSNEEQ